MSSDILAVGRRHFVMLFFALVLIVQVAMVSGEAYGLLPPLLCRSRIYMPAVIAIALTYVFDGSLGVRQLLSPLLKVKLHWGWYLFALGYAPAVCIIPVYFLNFIGVLEKVHVEWGMITDLEPGFLKLIVTVAIVEEITWVSCGIERLKAKYTVFVASLVGGTVWGIWWVPLNIAQIQIAGQFPDVLLVMNFAFIGGITAWLYAKTKSAIVVALMQVVTNFAGLTFPVFPTPGNQVSYVAFVLMKCLFVVVLFWRFGPKPLFVRQSSEHHAAIGLNARESV